MAEIKKSLYLLFDRPNEPLITPKGDEEIVFQLTDSLVPKEYANNGVELNNRFGDDASAKIPLKDLARYPDFKIASQLPSDAEFTLFIPRHQEMAAEVIDALMAVPENELQDFLSTCVYARGNLNPLLFNYCFSVVLMHRPDTKDVPIQNFMETFPSKFMDSRVFQKAREIAAVVPKNVQRQPIIIPRDYTATDLDTEHRLAYFREDIGVNLHHYHWHLVYPSNGAPIEFVRKDRRGELFFYMHQQIIARYNGERLNNALMRVTKFNNWREPIPEAYYPKLDSLTSSRGWPPRQANMSWQDLNRPVDGLLITIDDMERWRRNIEEAISTGMVINADGSTSSLDIDTLGNMLEASILSPNRDLYGTLHNNGHNFSAYIHDPQHRYLESFAVIADEATTMRDPLFYRWHAWVDDVFQRHKESAYVRAYTRSEGEILIGVSELCAIRRITLIKLENPGVAVTSIAIENDDNQKNTLNTFWMSSDVDLSRGLDFSNRGPVYARFTHLNHKPFRYVINVNNTGSARRTTVRIFISPKFDERNLPWALADQRKMMIEMDRFVTPLKAGQNTITRLSTQSSITIPFEQTFRDLSIQGDNAKRNDLASFNYCGCGWPQHMLVPKGTEAGATYQLFVMLSNYELDSIEQPGSEMTCVEASSFCGLRDRKYPDRRSMGFPFDRPSSTAKDIETFILPNMGLQDITIRLTNQTVVNPRNPKQN